MRGPSCSPRWAGCWRASPSCGRGRLAGSWFARTRADVDNLVAAGLLVRATSVATACSAEYGPAENGPAAAADPGRQSCRRLSVTRSDSGDGRTTTPANRAVSLIRLGDPATIRAEGTGRFGREPLVGARPSSPPAPITADSLAPSGTAPIASGVGHEPSACPGKSARHDTSHPADPVGVRWSRGCHILDMADGRQTGARSRR